MATHPPLPYLTPLPPRTPLLLPGGRVPRVRLLRRAGALALLLAALGTPAWAESGPHSRPAVQEARVTTPGVHDGVGAGVGAGGGTDGGIPGIVPIGCGLLLTAVAVCKHRGLPRSRD